MRPERRKRADGTEIDSVKNLAEYVQSFPMAASEAEPEPTTPVAYSAPPEPPAQPPVVAGPTQTEIDALRAEAKRNKEEAQRAQDELVGERTRREAENAARRVIAEQQPRPAPQAPQEDPRLNQVDELWFTDPKRARALMQEIQRDEMKKDLATQRTEVKREVFAELTTQQRKERADLAYSTAMIELQKRGVQPEQITADRLSSVYAMISRQPSDKWPNPYHAAGGPLNENVVIEGWKNLFGLPENGGATGTNAASNAGVAAPVAQPVPVAPPGSSRPAPAATPPRSGNDRLPALTSDMSRDLDHIAQAFGHDPEKLKARRRARLANERN